MDKQKDSTEKLFHRGKKCGFTLLETLMAISIITLSIIGPLSMASRSSLLISVSKNQLVATYLAQEGVEYVRFVRDTNQVRENVDPINTYDWLRGRETAPGVYDGNPGLGNCIDAGDLRYDTCYIDIPASTYGTIINCPTDGTSDCTNSGVHGPKTYLVKTDADGYRPAYQIAVQTERDGDPTHKETSFRRFIQVVPIIFDNGGTIGLQEEGAKVRVTVLWRDSYGEKRMDVQENIFKVR